MKKCKINAKNSQECRPMAIRQGHVRAMFKGYIGCWEATPTSTDNCAEAKDNVGRPRLTLADRCVQATNERCNPRPTSTNFCV